MLQKFLYEVSIVVLTDIIAILLTPGIFSPVLNDTGPIVSGAMKNRYFYTPPSVFNLEG